MVLTHFRERAQDRWKKCIVTDGDMWTLVFRLVFKAAAGMAADFDALQRNPSRLGFPIFGMKSHMWLYRSYKFSLLCIMRR